MIGPDGQTIYQGRPWHQDYEIPQRLAMYEGDYPNLFTVGGINPNGSLYHHTCPIAPDANVQPITVYALGSNVRVALNYMDNDYGMLEGCSFATPAVAGLIAYILGLPDQYTNLEQYRNLREFENFFHNIKQRIQQQAWQRTDNNKLITFPMDVLNYASWFPTQVKSIHNGVWSDFCSNGRNPPKVKRDPQAPNYSLDDD